MAKKSKKSLKEKLKILDKLSNNINKNKGKTICGRLNDKQIQNKLRISYIETPSSNLNLAMGGGWPRKKMTVVVGKEDSGKTMCLLETIANNQKKDPNFVAGWLESENSLVEDAIDMFGIDRERFFYQELERDGAGEDALNLVEAILSSGACDMFVINSLSALVPKKEYVSVIEKDQVALQARMNSRMCRKFIALLSEYNTAFVVVCHLSTDIGSMSYDPYIIKGGKAIMYMASIILDYRKRAIAKEDPIDREEGMKINVSVKKNHCIIDRNPYVKTEYYAIFGQGTEQYLEIINNAIEQDILVKNGAFIKDVDENGEPKILQDGTKLQWQGIKKAKNYCIEHPEYFEYLKSQVNGFVQNMSEEEVSQAKEIEKEVEKNIEKDIEDVVEKASI